jgi:hypothetical protein
MRVNIPSAGRGLLSRSVFWLSVKASQREKIMRSFKQFTAVYNNKHQELLGRLEKVLREIGECERQYFGDADWYNRYGFIFHSFMSLHYAR